jgi:ABC-2 type transport system permease protein
VQFLPAFILPQFLLCGLLTPRENLPGVLKSVSDILPLSYAVDAMRSVTLDSSATGDVVRDVLIVGAFVVGALALGSATLRRRTP